MIFAEGSRIPSALYQLLVYPTKTYCVLALPQALCPMLGIQVPIHMEVPEGRRLKIDDVLTELA